LAILEIISCYRELTDIPSETTSQLKIPNPYRMEFNSQGGQSYESNICRFIICEALFTGEVEESVRPLM
jgi:hypothetical protein